MRECWENLIRYHHKHMEARVTPHDKLKPALRQWMTGAGYYKAIRAMEFAAKVHTGVRKDGKTPEFAHQVAIAGYVQTLLPSLMHPEETLCAVFLHDVVEDYEEQVPLERVRDLFGESVSDPVGRLTKVMGGVKKDINRYFAGVASCPISSFVKLGDRVHNFQSMVGVFSYAKQREYLEEGRIHFLPMLRQARRNFPEQTLAYENVKFLLKSQMSLIEAIHATAAEPSHEDAIPLARAI